MTGAEFLQGLELAKSGIDLTNKVNLFENLMRYTRKKPKILILGPAGTGKSQFISSLTHNEPKILDRTKDYKELKFGFYKHFIYLIDTPGDTLKQVIRKQQIKRLGKNHGIEGIINICSNGYFEAPDAGRKIAMPHKTIGQTYLQDNLKVELNMLDEWLDEIEPNQNLKWIINLVTKADLWWDNYETVLNHYEQGDYFKKMEPLSRYVNTITVPYCSIIKPFFDVSRNSSFGEIEKLALKNQFTSILSNLITK